MNPLPNKKNYTYRIKKTMFQSLLIVYALAPPSSLSSTMFSFSLFMGAQKTPHSRDLIFHNFTGEDNSWSYFSQFHGRRQFVILFSLDFLGVDKLWYFSESIFQSMFFRVYFSESIFQMIIIRQLFLRP